MIRLTELIARAQNGDQEALAQVVERFLPIVKKYSHDLDHDEAYSDLIAWIVVAVNRYKPKSNWGKNELSFYLSNKKKIE
ncbi:hypothetical protein SAMN05660649_03401 [Desulfotomaculum arcticum]|uniref:Helix-turn-helix conjugative transposon-like domain-containing protein n=1 Tax=Desulfotruncus arcticus DSM 17038 TaxID=1121424 RepID=A0A1I2WD25_9FIRM|nr:helix-turn-helix domain-containing protein [Desulfotruncus arcticus]SFG98619.1 hypothetical protein SAMN05660649_03401 [Desulfotomaculum arcticum] [Desulfotruncus arcticus DSM 17038]